MEQQEARTRHRVLNAAASAAADHVQGKCASQQSCRQLCSEHCCDAEQKAGDRGAIARASGDYAIVVAHNPEAGITRIKLPSGSKKVRRCRPGMGDLPARLLCLLSWNSMAAPQLGELQQLSRTKVA